MSRRVIRLGSNLSFDEEQERDIIDKVESLSNKHKLGEFISHLIRVAFECPDKLENKEELTKTLSELERYGMAHNRFEFFNSVNKRLEEMKVKVDAMHEMNIKLLNLARFGKHMGLESKTDNMLRTQFALEQQLTEICVTMGVTHPKHVFSSNKIQETHDKANNIFNYIIETYDNIVNELQHSVIREVVQTINTPDSNQKSSSITIDRQQAANSNKQHAEVTVSNTQILNSNTAIESEKQQIAMESKKDQVKFNDVVESEKDFVDFGGADLDALANFFGKQ